MNLELKKRIITSILLILIILFMFLSEYIMLFVLLIISLISFIEFTWLTNNIFKYSNLKKLFSNIFYLLYIFTYVIIFFISTLIGGLKLFLLFLILICVASDIGGFVFGKIFKGPKLTKISPKKTISGSIGSFLFSIILSLTVMNLFNLYFTPLKIIILAISVSFGSQIGDIFFSYMKRKAKVKDTGNLLPGHGGVLDRIDGILLGLPFGVIISSLIFIIFNL